MSKHKTLGVRIPEQTHARLAEVADKYDVSMATVVRWAIAAYFEQVTPIAEARKTSQEAEALDD